MSRADELREQIEALKTLRDNATAHKFEAEELTKAVTTAVGKVQAVKSQLDQELQTIEDDLEEKVNQMIEQKRVDLEKRLEAALGGEKLDDIMTELNSQREAVKHALEVDQAVISTYNFRIADLEAELKQLEKKGGVGETVRKAVRR